MSSSSCSSCWMGLWLLQWRSYSTHLGHYHRDVQLWFTMNTQAYKQTHTPKAFCNKQKSHIQSGWLGCGFSMCAYEWVFVCESFAVHLQVSFHPVSPSLSLVGFEPASYEDTMTEELSCSALASLGTLKHTHTHTILELISEFNKVAGYKIDIERQIVFYILSVYHTKIKLRKQFYLKYYQKN